MTANKSMTGEQLDELITVAVNMQRDSEKSGDRPTAMFAYAVQVAVLELRKARTDFSALAAENAGVKAAKEIIRHLNVNREEANFCGIDDCYIDDAVAAMITPATDAFMAEVRASALDEFAKAQDEQANKYYELSPGCSGQNECQFAAGQARYFAECIRKGVQS